MPVVKRIIVTFSVVFAFQITAAQAQRIEFSGVRSDSQKWQADALQAAKLAGSGYHHWSGDVQLAESQTSEKLQHATMWVIWSSNAQKIWAEARLDGSVPDIPKLKTIVSPAGQNRISSEFYTFGDPCSKPSNLASCDVDRLPDSVSGMLEAARILKILESGNGTAKRAKVGTTPKSVAPVTISVSPAGPSTFECGGCVVICRIGNEIYTFRCGGCCGGGCGPQQWSSIMTTMQSELSSRLGRSMTIDELTTAYVATTPELLARVP